MKTNQIFIIFVLLGSLLLASCAPNLKVGELQTASQSVELGDASSVRVEIDLGAGDLELTGNANKLLEADFAYNVARLKPEIEYTDSKLVVRQPDAKGLPALQGILKYRNEWGLRLNDNVPMDLSVNIGAGTSNMQLAGLSLTRLDVSLGASDTTIDLSGNWMRDLNVTIDAGAATLSVQLPAEVGARVEVEAGPLMIDAPGLTKDGNAYTNAAYGVSEVTLQVNIKAGIGQIKLAVEDQSQMTSASALFDGWLVSRDVIQPRMAVLQQYISGQK